MDYTPIALFTYNRPWHTRQTIEALLKNPEAAGSDLTIFCDGPRKDSHIESVHQVREYLRTVNGFKSVQVMESHTNKGLAKSIISGVSEMLKKYQSTIVLEDDMITSPSFLKYMNQSLKTYEKNDQVISIHGYMYPVNEKLPDTFFLKGAECWGWATWRRGWELFDPNSSRLLLKIILNGKMREFDFDGGYPYTRMLLRQCLGEIDSWAIRWYASAFLANKLTLYPGRSLVENIGLDGSGVHSKSWSKHVFETALTKEEINLANTTIEESKLARKALSDYFKQTRTPLAVKIIYTFKDMFKKSSMGKHTQVK
jgi:hypothetical protein